ncbi:gap junction gamma-1 protein [Striga asiatica]|uniref:Gap junction gamma-1 protein n=1 Tax=Striga asiatica TaxID=4170 RepID=A0A5A7P9C9_STRAF|nr:gap junction gamma-1 protein [Striga asiatica]
MIPKPIPKLEIARPIDFQSYKKTKNPKNLNRVNLFEIASEQPIANTFLPLTRPPAMAPHTNSTASRKVAIRCSPSVGDRSPAVLAVAAAKKRPHLDGEAERHLSDTTPNRRPLSQRRPFPSPSIANFGQGEEGEFEEEEEEEEEEMEICEGGEVKEEERKVTGNKKKRKRRRKRKREKKRKIYMIVRENQRVRGIQSAVEPPVSEQPQLKPPNPRTVTMSYKKSQCRFHQGIRSTMRES